MKKQVINKYFMAIVILSVFCLLPGIYSKAEGIKEIPNVEKVVIPEGITSLDELADANGKQFVLENVKELYLPSTLTEFGEHFQDAKVFPNLQSIYVAEGNKSYQSIDGCLYTVDGAELCFVPKGYEGKLTLPVGTMRVSQSALMDCSKMTEIQIPYGVTDLAPFTNCDRLKKVVIPSSVEYGVGFYGCDQLEIIKYKWETPYEYLIGKVIKDCPKLRKICVPKGTKKDYQKRIKGTAKKLIKVGNYKPQIVEIKTLEKPKLTVFQKENASSYWIYFNWDQVLYADSYKVQMKINGKWATLSSHVFTNYNQANPNRYQNVQNYFSIHGMKEGEVCYVRVIAYRDSVKSISVPQEACWLDSPEIDYETNYEKGTVAIKWKKKNVTGYKIKVVGSDGSSQEYDIKETEKNEKAITGLKKGTAYDIHISAYKRIGETEWTSDEASIRGIIDTDIEKLNVEQLVIPEGITSLDEFANTYIGMREKDKVLENVKELHLPSTLTEFRGSWEAREIFPNLQSIHVAEGNERLSYHDGILYENWEGVKKYILWALQNTASGDVVMPSTVRGVYSEAFEGCNLITSLTFSKEFKYMYLGDGYEDEAYVPVRKKNLGICKNIKAYYVEEGNEKYKAINGCLYSADGAELYMVPQGYEGKFIIAKGTMRVVSGAFDDCINMTAIKIPYGVTDLATFVNCDGLKKVVIPGSVEHVNGFNGVFFRECDNLESVKLKWKQPFEKLNTRYKYTIARKCPNLKAIYIPKGTKKSYQNRTKGVTKKLLKVGDYEPQLKKIKKLDKPKVNVTIESFGAPGIFYVSWEQVLYAEGYEVQVKVGEKWKTIELDSWTRVDEANPDRYYDFPLSVKAKKIGVKEGEACYFRVIAYRGSVKSISKPQKAYWIDRPEIPSTESEKGTITLKWKKKNVTGYKIQVYGSDGSEREFVIKGAGKTRKTITGLVPGIWYEIYMSAYIKSGKQEWCSFHSPCLSVKVTEKET